MKKKLLAVLTALTLAVGMIGCGGNNGFNADEEISIITREDGSGTRGAFIELFGIEQKDADGNMMYTNPRVLTIYELLVVSSLPKASSSWEKAQTSVHRPQLVHLSVSVILGS